MSKRLNNNLKSKLSDILVCLLVIATLFTCVQTAQALPKPVDAMDGVVCAAYMTDTATNEVPSLEDVTPRHLVDIETEYNTDRTAGARSQPSDKCRIDKVINICYQHGCDGGYGECHHKLRDGRFRHFLVL